MNWAWTISKSADGGRSTGTCSFPNSATCSAHASSKSFKRKKKANSEYLTVEMVRDAASAVVETFGMPPSAGKIILSKCADRINYYLKRNCKARESHTKTTRARLHALGIDVDKLPSCARYDSS